MGLSSLSHAEVAVEPTPLQPSWAVAPLTCEEKESISASISQTWTDQAIKCYMTKADCLNCSVFRGNYSFTCQMSKVVPVLLENLGEPEHNRMEKLRPFLYD